MTKQKATDNTDDDVFDVSAKALADAVARSDNGEPGSVQARLKSFIERIENVAEEKQTCTDDMKEIYSEAKGVGFDVKIIRMVVKRRKMERADLLEQEELLDLYERALGDRV